MSSDPHEANDPRSAPGDEVPPGHASTGENICPDCGGEGRRGGEPCPTCDGTGRVTEAVGGG